MATKGQKSPYYSLAPSKGVKFILPQNIRFVHRDIRLRVFLPLFCKIAKNARKISKSVEGRKSHDILKLLNEIIPAQYFGTAKHRKLFYKIVKLVLTRSANECVYVRSLIRGFELTKIPWLAPILKQNAVNSKQLCRRYFFDAQVWLLERIVKPLINRIYYPVRTGQTHEIDLIPRHIWLSFHRKVIHSLESKGHLVHEVKAVRPRGILQIRPKNGYNNPDDFRPIMRLTPERCVNHRKLKERNRKIRKTLSAAAEKMCLTKTTNLYHHWRKYVAYTHGQNIFAVKVDVKDAFGSINIDLLCYILETQCVNNRIPLSIKSLITQHIKNQFVTIGRNKSGSPKIWQWKHGLLQGDRFSSALCQLYMSYMDGVYLDKFCNKPTVFIHRTVDDYFFCSTNEAEAETFIRIMSSIHTLNTSKTESNLAAYGHNEIGYCGQIFAMSTKQVKSLYSFKKHTEIRHRFRLWNLKRPIFCKQEEQKTVEEFLKRPLTFTSNCYRFKNMELNTIFNNETTVMQNYFQAMIFLAFKIDAAIMAIYNGIKQFTRITTIIKKTAYKYAQRAVKKLKENKGQHYTGVLSLQIFLKVGLQAFILVLRKRMLYKKHKMLDSLVKYMGKIYVGDLKQVNFKDFKTMPKFFNNISLQRRLPHRKVYEIC